MQNRRKVGRTYEEAAAVFLEQRGWKILERNFSCRAGEIDLIAQDGRVLVFLEVKYRKNADFGTPAEAVTARKRSRLCRTADYYRMLHRIPEQQPCRFDVAAILGENIEVIKNAFEYG